MRNDGPDIESPTLRSGGIAQTIILSAVASAHCSRCTRLRSGMEE